MLFSTTPWFLSFMYFLISSVENLFFIKGLLKKMWKKLIHSIFTFLQVPGNEPITNGSQKRSQESHLENSSSNRLCFRSALGKSCSDCKPLPSQQDGSRILLVLIPLQAPDPLELGGSSGKGPGLLSQTQTHAWTGTQHELKPKHEHELKAKAKTKPNLNLNLKATQSWPEPNQNSNHSPKPRLNQTQSWAQPKHKPNSIPHLNQSLSPTQTKTQP